MNELTRWVFFLALLYCAYAYALKPQVWQLFQIGWKRLHKRFAVLAQPLSPSPSLIRVGWNQYQAAVQTTEVGVYVQRQSTNAPAECLLIPYATFRVGQATTAFKLLTADAYDFFTVDGIQVWGRKEYGSVITSRITL